jgi:ATP-dependent DNA helicase RecG
MGVHVCPRMSEIASNSKLRVFISSVQKELELERAAVAGLITTDPFLLQHCEPVLFENEPPAARPAPQGYLAALRGCALYVLIVANEYGQADGELSATHHEYREAQRLKLPTIVFLKGRDETRSPEVKALIAEIKKDRYKYVRFHDREDLKPEMAKALRRALAEEFNLKATSNEITASAELIDAASTFEAGVIAESVADQFDQHLLKGFNDRIADHDVDRVWRSPWEAMQSRGLALRGTGGTYAATNAAWLLFAEKPAGRFPQAEILADAYDDTRITGRPKGQLTINAALPFALEQALKFIDDHTFHPRRVVGLNNLRLDEYPVAALREALVNAVAHRSYEDRSRKIFVRVFSDRIEVASPGYAPQPLTLAKLRKGGYRPCSRNPLIAQTLATLGVMEQRGSGFARMSEAMLNHGLTAPEIAQQDGFFVVTLRGPAGDYDRLKVPSDAPLTIPASVEARLTKRQQQMMAALARGEVLTSRKVQQRFKISPPVVHEDFKRLLDEGLIARVGAGRATRYVLRSVPKSSGNH